MGWKGKPQLRSCQILLTCGHVCEWLSWLLTDAGLISLWAAPFLGHVVLGYIKVMMKHRSASKPMSSPARSSPSQSLPLLFWVTSCPEFPQRWTESQKYKPNSPFLPMLLLVWVFNYSMRSQTRASGSDQRRLKTQTLDFHRYGNTYTQTSLPSRASLYIWMCTLTCAYIIYRTIKRNFLLFNNLVFILWYNISNCSFSSLHSSMYPSPQIYCSSIFL